MYSKDELVRFLGSLDYSQVEIRITAKVPEGTTGQPSELEMHRADYKAVRAAGWESPGELLAAYKCLAEENKDCRRRLDDLRTILAHKGNRRA